jgi:hypothetical protein
MQIRHLTSLSFSTSPLLLHEPALTSTANAYQLQSDFEGTNYYSLLHQLLLQHAVSIFMTVPFETKVDYTIPSSTAACQIPMTHLHAWNKSLR